MRIGLLGAAVCAATLAGCELMPAEQNVLEVPIETSRTYTAQTKDQVWSKLVQWFASNQISIKTIEKDSGIIYAEQLGVRITTAGDQTWVTYASCGAGFMMSPQSRDIRLNVLMTEPAAKQVMLTVTATFSEMRLSSLSGASGNVDCRSIGGLEKRILDHVGPGVAPK